MQERDAALGAVLEALAKAVGGLSEQVVAQEHRTAAQLARLESQVRGAGEVEALRAAVTALELDNASLRMGATALQSALEESTAALASVRGVDLGAPVAEVEVRESAFASNAWRWRQQPRSLAWSLSSLN